MTSSFIPRIIRTWTTYMCSFAKVKGGETFCEVQEVWILDFEHSLFRAYNFKGWNFCWPTENWSRCELATTHKCDRDSKLFGTNRLLEAICTRIFSSSDTNDKIDPKTCDLQVRCGLWIWFSRNESDWYWLLFWPCQWELVVLLSLAMPR